jgi:hypothetical protein
MAIGTADTALIAAGLAFLSVPLGAVISAWLRSRDKREDWRRQDLMAARASADSAALQAAAAKQLAETRSANAATRSQLSQIQSTGVQTQKFVDGAYTAQLRVELSVQQAFAAMTRTAIALMQAAGDSPTIENQKLLAGTEARIAVLEPLIAERTAYMDTLAEAALTKINAEPTM